MPQPQRPVDLTSIPTTTIRERQSRLHLEALAAPVPANAPAIEILSALPKVGLSDDLNRAAYETREAARRDRAVIALIGREVMEKGYSPLIVSMMEQGIISALAMDGRGALCDFELAYYGQTDEDPTAATYGSSREVGEAFNHILNEGVARGFGLGEFLGRSLLERAVRHADFSILAHGSAKRIPVTVHPLIGADPVHRYVSASGAVLGKGAHRDFLIFTGELLGLDNGGIILDFWSDGLHEIFDQAIAAACQANRQPLNGWQYLQFHSACNAPARPWRSLEGVKHTMLQGDPLLLALFHLGVIGAEGI